ncbi:fibroblast growth factor-binding protein 3 [Megalops cyprinoides]|uniref:fibroblast growth factor-binding protein 3 n=1 Tax=Megalops cyprinoides TaxID=118141 RepID=UPI001863C1FB|nr:fibroblast growth factor-binding protein 3 [Megalops cyprinoides]
MNSHMKLISAMRLRCALLLLLCLSGLQGAEGNKESGNNQQPTKMDKSKPVPSSGELISKDNHRCTWETSGEGEVTLLVICSHGEESYQCRYMGQPDLCPSYSAKSSQYWKQVVGKLKKKRNACEGEKVLKTRTCKKAPVEAHLTLEESAVEDRGKERLEMKPLADPGPREKEKVSLAEERDRLGEVNDGSQAMEPLENYCAEGWHSVCSFFVKFFDG